MVGLRIADLIHRYQLPWTLMTIDDPHRFSWKHISHNFKYPFIRHIAFSFFPDRHDEMIITFLDDLFRALAGFDPDFDIHARRVRREQVRV